MVSASHNPADDNGLKVLDGAGLKLDDAVEDELEQLIWRAEELGGVTERAAGPDRRRRPELVDDYREHRLGLAGSVDADRPAAGPRRRERFRLRRSAPRSCARPARRSRSSTPTPTGSTSTSGPGRPTPASLAEAVVASGADVGFALDGDADRLIAVDATGRSSMATRSSGILALDRLARGALPGGARRVGALQRRPADGRRGGRRAGRADARRRQVHPRGDAGLRARVLGGEKSGHVIVLEHTTSGDGIVTALEVLRVMAASGADARDLAAAIPLLPQQQRAVKARHKDQWEARSAPSRRAIAEASGPTRRHRSRPRPALRDGAGAPGHGRGTGRGAGDRTRRLARGPRGGATKLAAGAHQRRHHAGPPGGGGERRT